MEWGGGYGIGALASAQASQAAPARLPGAGVPAVFALCREGALVLGPPGRGVPRGAGRGHTGRAPGTEGGEMLASVCPKVP